MRAWNLTLPCRSSSEIMTEIWSGRDNRLSKKEVEVFWLHKKRQNFSKFAFQIFGVYFTALNFTRGPSQSRRLHFPKITVQYPKKEFEILKHWVIEVHKLYLAWNQSYTKNTTISDVCSTDWQKKDSAFLSSVAFL